MRALGRHAPENGTQQVLVAVAGPDRRAEAFMRGDGDVGRAVQAADFLRRLHHAHQIHVERDIDDAVALQQRLQFGRKPEVS